MDAKQRDVLLALALKYDGDWMKIWHCIEKRDYISNQEVEEAKKLNLDYITLLDEQYPNVLKNIHNPPFILFYKGDISILDRKYISVVGTREPSEYGLFMTEKIVKGLCDNGYGVVSGLAIGVDAKAHQVCLDNDMPTIAVLGNGLNKYYLKSNEKLFNDIINYGGLILTEYPPNVEATPDKFCFRNRIVASLGSGVLVTEAHPKSGTMITVKDALFIGKDVYVVPHNCTSNTIGNRWIKEGAILVENAEDIIEEQRN